MANFDLILATLADSQPVSAADLKYLAECIAKCGNLTNGSAHALSGTLEFTSGKIKLSGTAEIEFAEITSWPKLVAHAQERGLRAPWVPEAFGTYSNWGYNYDSDGCWHCGTTDELRIACEETMETGGTLTGVDIRIKHGTHGTWPPQYRSHVSLYKKDIYDASLTLIDDKDADASQEAYEGVTLVTWTGLSETFDPHERLYIRVATEHGTNAVVGTELVGGTVTQSFTELRQV